MSNSTFSTLRWLLELTKTFLKGAPVSTQVSVITTLISQVSIMLAFLMPLKVVMMLGSEDIPKFFPNALLGYERDTLIISLVILSIVFYLISIIFGKLTKQSTERGARRLIANTQKIIIFENQDNLASNAYTKYTDALAGFIFTLVTILLLAIFYTDVALLTIIFLMAAYLVTYVLYSVDSKLKATINKTPQTATSTISNILFLFIFLYIVIDFLYLTPPEFIVALAAIITGRLMLVRLSFTAAYIFSLKKDEGKINALFFHHHAFLPVDSNQYQSVWTLLADDVLQNWLEPLLQEVMQEVVSEISVEWIQTRLNRIVVLKVETSDTALLIKLFEDKISSQAQHESTLLIELPDSQFPCPPLLHATMVEKCHCHIFDITGHELLPQKEANKLNHKINVQLLSVTPSNDLIERYRRSKALIWERIDLKMMSRLRLVATKEERPLILEFESVIPQIKAVLQVMPLSFVNHKLNNTSLLLAPENQIVSFHWSTWVVEPAGFGVPLDNSINMNESIKVASESRPELQQHPIQSYELAALLASCEQRFEQQQYRDAIKLLPQIIHCINDHQPNRVNLW